MLRLTLVGGGPGGYEAAFAAARAGMQVTLVEREALGGTCLNQGCIPTKSLKASAEALETIRRAAEFGLAGSGDPRPNMPAVIARKDKIRDILRGGLEKTCSQLGIRRIQGQGRVVHAGLVRVTAPDGSVTDVEGDRLILATGSRSLDLPALPPDHSRIISSDDALELHNLPARVVIVGGGVIGCEMAGIFRSFGVAVTLVEGLDRLLPLPGVDADISKLLLREFKKKGLACQLGKTVLGADVQADGTVRVKLGPSPFLPAPASTPASGPEKTTELETDLVLVCVGRVPNTEGLGLEDAGIATDNRGWIAVDAGLQTSLPGCYAIGDVLGPSHVMLAHAASAEGLAAVEACLGNSVSLDYNGIPSAIFTTPEIGCVGLSEAQAAGIGEIHSATVQMRELGKAQAMGELSGLVKMIADKASGRILGVHIAGAHASDLIAEAALAVHMGATARDIAATVHAHPTLAEGLHEAACSLVRQQRDRI